MLIVTFQWPFETPPLPKSPLEDTALQMWIQHYINVTQFIILTI